MVFVFKIVNDYIMNILISSFKILILLHPDYEFLHEGVGIILQDNFEQERLC